MGWWLLVVLSMGGARVRLLGVLWILIGVGVWLGANTTISEAPHTVIPFEVRSVAWLITGVAAVALARNPRFQSLAVGGLMLMPAMRTTSYLYAWVMSVVPGGDAGLPSGWYQACVHAVLMLAVWFTAGDGK